MILKCQPSNRSNRGCNAAAGASAAVVAGYVNWLSNGFSGCGWVHGAVVFGGDSGIHYFTLAWQLRFRISRKLLNTSCSLPLPLHTSLTLK